MSEQTTTSRFVSRFAAGDHTGMLSGEWRIWSAKNQPDLYVAIRSLGQFKAAVHCPRADKPTWRRHKASRGDGGLSKARRREDVAPLSWEQRHGPQFVRSAGGIKSRQRLRAAPAQGNPLNGPNRLNGRWYFDSRGFLIRGGRGIAVENDFAAGSGPARQARARLHAVVDPEPDEVAPLSWTPDFLSFRSPTTARSPRYVREFRRQMIELVRAGRGPEELAKEFEPSAQAIRNWVAQADRDGRRADGLTTAEREELNRLRREIRQLKLERRSKSRGLVRSGDGCDPAEGFQFVSENRAVTHRRDVPHLGRLPQRLLRVGEAAGLCASPGAALTAEIRAAHAASRPYGAPLSRLILRKPAWCQSQTCCPADAESWFGRREPSQEHRHDRAGWARQAPILSTAISPRISPIGCGWPISRTFERGRLPLSGGCARCVQPPDRRWSMATTLHMQVVLDALNMALWQRRPSGVIHHSDHGSQYTSIEFGKRCREAGVRPSMGSVGDAYDNAMAESFFTTLECGVARSASPRRRPKRAWPSSNSSRASTIRAGDTHR